MHEKGFPSWIVSLYVSRNQHYQGNMYMPGNSSQHPPQLKKFRRFVYISPVITILSLTLLLWTYRPSRTFQFRSRYYRSGSEPQIPVQLPSGQTGLQGQKVFLVAVNGTKTLLVGAYQEHRTGRREVRLIAVVLRREEVSYHCLLRCDKELRITEGVRKIHSDHFGFAYGTADIMCPIPSGCETPSHITVTSALDSEDILQKQFLEVKNQNVQKDSFPYNFTVCYSTMFDFTNVLQLVQSLEMLQLMGVNRVVIYKTSNSPEIQHILDYYTYKGLLEVIPWSLSRFLNVSRGWLPVHGPGDLHYYGQIPALNDCVYRYMYQSKYIALHDTDELILPQSVNSWLELFPVLEEKYGANKCYIFENNRFSSMVTLPPPAPQTLPPQSCCPGWQKVPGVNILAHLYHEAITATTHSRNFKIIVNPRVVFAVTVHGLLSPENVCSWVDRNIARMYHIRSQKEAKPTPDQLVYDGRLLNYSAHLIPNVNTVLIESGLLSEDAMTLG